MFVDPEGAGLAELDLAAACGRAGARVREVQPGVLRRVCDTVTPQPLAAIVRAVDVPLQQVGPAPTGLVVVCVRGARPRQSRDHHPQRRRRRRRGRGLLRRIGRPVQPQDGPGFGRRAVPRPGRGRT